MFSVCESESLEHTQEFRDQILRVLDDETVRCYTQERKGVQTGVILTVCIFQVPFILVGNKVDLAHLRKVSSSEAQALASEWNCPYIETSAKTRHNVEQVYTVLMRQIRDRKLKQQNSSNPEKNSCCVIL